MHPILWLKTKFSNFYHKIDGVYLRDAFNIDFQHPVIDVLTGPHKGVTISILQIFVTRKSQSPKYHVLLEKNSEIYHLPTREMKEFEAYIEKVMTRLFPVDS